MNASAFATKITNPRDDLAERRRDLERLRDELRGYTARAANKPRLEAELAAAQERLRSYPYNAALAGQEADPAEVRRLGGEAREVDARFRDAADAEATYLRLQPQLKPLHEAVKAAAKGVVAEEVEGLLTTYHRAISVADRARRALDALAKVAFMENDGRLATQIGQGLKRQLAAPSPAFHDAWFSLTERLETDPGATAPSPEA